MNLTTKDSIKILILAAVVYAGINYVSAQSGPGNPPNSNVPDLLNVSSSRQVKDGALKINTTTTNPATVGLNISQGVQSYSTTPGYARVYVNESGDGAGNWAGIEFRKSGVMEGGLFKKGDSAEANNNIAIWDKIGAIISVRQDDVTEFSGTVKIQGGSPAANNVLTAVDDTGLATWKAVGSGTTQLSSTIYSHWAALGQNSPDQPSASCPDGELMVGFVLTVQAIKNAGTNPGGMVFCRKVIIQ